MRRQDERSYRASGRTRLAPAPPHQGARRVSRGACRSAEGEVIAEMTEPKATDASKFDNKLHKLIKRAEKQHGMLWPVVVSKLELARADVKAMIKIYDSRPK
jgi:hypothetical protein